MDDPRQGEPGSARHQLWWAIWDNYTENVKAALIDNLIAEHSAVVREQDPVTCPCCGR
jgi:hypothetical protein